LKYLSLIANFDSILEEKFFLKDSLR